MKYVVRGYQDFKRFNNDLGYIVHKADFILLMYFPNRNDLNVISNYRVDDDNVYRQIEKKSFWKVTSDMVEPVGRDREIDLYEL